MQGHPVSLHPVVKGDDLSLGITQARVGPNHNLGVLVPIAVQVGIGPGNPCAPRLDDSRDQEVLELPALLAASPHMPAETVGSDRLGRVSSSVEGIGCTRRCPIARQPDSSRYQLEFPEIPDVVGTCRRLAAARQSNPARCCRDFLARR